MKFTIDLEDFWLDRDDEIVPALKAHIIRDVVAKIEATIKDKIEKHITEEVKKRIDERMTDKMNQFIDDVIASETIKVSGEEISLTDWIKKQFQTNQGYRSPHESIVGVAKKHAEDMKARYDLMFATQIVSKMTENGFIEKEVAEKLLEASTPK